MPRYELDELGELVLEPSRRRRSIGGFLGQTPACWRRIWVRRRLPRSRCIRTAASGYPTSSGWPPSNGALCNDQTPLQTVPDVCVEVVSPSNTREEILMKVGAYLRGGARRSDRRRAEGRSRVLRPRRQAGGERARHPARATGQTGRDHDPELEPCERSRRRSTESTAAGFGDHLVPTDHVIGIAVVLGEAWFDDFR